MSEESQRPKSRHLLALTLQKAWEHSVFSEAAEAAYWQALSLAPLMLGLLGLLGYASDWFGADVATRASDQIINICRSIFSQGVVDSLVAPTVRDMLTHGKGAIASVGFLIALWAGSSAMASFVDAITEAHGQYGDRNEVWQRFFSLLLYVVSLAGLIVGLPILAIGPNMIPQFFPDRWQATIADWVGSLYYPAVGAIIVIAITTLYKVALPRKLPWHRGLPGAILAMAVFLLTSSGLRFYLSYITRTGYTYGALATFVAFLLFLFFIGLAIVSGAYFNAAIQELWPAKPPRWQRRKWRSLQSGDDSAPASGDEPAVESGNDSETPGGGLRRTDDSVDDSPEQSSAGAAKTTETAVDQSSPPGGMDS